MKRWKYRKVTPEILEEMRELYATGNYKQNQIAEMFGLSQSNVNYWLNPKSREVALKRSNAYNKKHPKKRPYNAKQKNYMRERYQNDEEFRERMLASILKYQHSPKGKATIKAKCNTNAFIKFMDKKGIKHI